jgi:hypothetical protein
MNLKKWLLGSSAAAVLAVGALGGITAYADTTIPASPAAPAVAEAPESTAPESTTPEVPEANDPALPGGGHDDGTAANVDNQFDGVQ